MKKKSTNEDKTNTKEVKSRKVSKRRLVSISALSKSEKQVT